MAPNEKDDRTDADTLRAGCPVEQLGWVANRTLSPDERAAVEAHLPGCSACREDLEAWSQLGYALRAVSAQTPEPSADLFARVERQLDTLPSRSPFSRGVASSVLPQGWFQLPSPVQVWQACLLALNVCIDHFRAQARLIRRELFWMPLLLIPLAGWIIAEARSGQQAFAPGTVTETAALAAALLTALGMAFLYGQEVDPAREMVLAAPTSPRLVLGVRCCLVFAYDLILNCGIVLPLLASQGIITPGRFLTNWLAPLFCLSAIALLLSIIINPATAVAVCALLSIVRVIDSLQILGDVPWQRVYEGFWSQGLVLFVAGALAILLAFGLVERRERLA